MHTYCIEEHKAPNKEFGLYLGISISLVIIGILLISLAHVYYPTDTNSLLITDVFGATMIVIGFFLGVFLILEKNEKLKLNGNQLMYEMLFHKKVATSDKHYVAFSTRTNNKDKAYLNLLVYRKGDKEYDQQPPLFVYSFEIADRDLNNVKPILDKWVPLLLEADFDVHMSEDVMNIAKDSDISLKDITVYHVESPIEEN